MDALAQAVTSLVPTLLRQARALVGFGQEAEDLVFDTVASLLPVWSTIAISPAAYARRAMINRHLDLIRRRNVANSHVHEIARPSSHMTEDATIAHLDLVHALKDLPPRTRTILVLRYLEDLTARDIAKIIRLPEGTVRRVVHEGLHLLRLNGHLTGSDIETTTTVGRDRRP